MASTDPAQSESRPSYDGRQVQFVTPLTTSTYAATSLDWPMVRVGRHKLMRLTADGPRVLFDLLEDPLERVNRIADPALKSVRDDLDARLDRVLGQPVLDVPAPA